MHAPLWVIWWPEKRAPVLTGYKPQTPRAGNVGSAKSPQWTRQATLEPRHAPHLSPPHPHPPAHHPHHPPGLAPHGSDEKHSGKRTCASICPHSLQTYLSPTALPPSSALPTGLAHRVTRTGTLLLPGLSLAHIPAVGSGRGKEW